MIRSDLVIYETFKLGNKVDIVSIIRDLRKDSVFSIIDHNISRIVEEEMVMFGR